MANLATQAHTALTLNRDAANRLTKAKGVTATHELLQDAASDLEARLAQAESLGGPGEASFTAARLRATLAQVKEVTRSVASGLKPIIVDNAGEAAEAATSHTLEYLYKADAAFKGIGETPLALREASVFDRAKNGAQASVLRRLVQVPDASTTPVKMGIIQRYGVETISHFEDILQRGLLTGKSLQEMRSEIIEKSPFLQGAPLHWATRIVRTETAAAYGKSQLETLNASNEELGDMVKILCATFDERTGADSYAVHGQIRRPDEPFESWFGEYMHPPNRPNDREIIVPHRISWEIPDYLTPLDDGEVEERWEQLGNKKEMPERPEMSTVDLDLFGQESERTSSASQIDFASESPELATDEQPEPLQMTAGETPEFADTGAPEEPIAEPDEDLSDMFGDIQNEIDLPPEAIEEILTALTDTGAEDEDMASFMQSYPLDSVEFEDLPNTEEYEYVDDPPKMTLNASLEPTHDWVPTKSQSVAHSADTPDDAVKAAGHKAMADHIRLSGPNTPVQAQIQEAIDTAFESAMSNPITKQAENSANDYFAESYAAYRLHPEDLKTEDPVGYKLVKKVLSKRGIVE